MSEPKTEKKLPPFVFERERGVYAIDVTRDVAHAIIELGTEDALQADALRVLRLLADASIPVFCVKMHRTAVTLALAGTDLERATATLQIANLRAKTRRDLCLVAVRAASMRDLYGVMSDIADALSAAKANIYALSDSHNSVQCLIEAERLPQALNSLRKTFRLAESVIEESSIETEGMA